MVPCIRRLLIVASWSCRVLVPSVTGCGGRRLAELQPVAGVRARASLGPFGRIHAAVREGSFQPDPAVTRSVATNKAVRNTLHDLPEALMISNAHKMFNFDL